MKALNPYLNFKGNTEEAFNFYRSVFGGEFVMLMRYKDTHEAARLTGDDLEKIMHIALPIGMSVLMATDVLDAQGFDVTPGNNFHISFNGESEAEIDSIFEKLSAGGQVMVAPKKEFWGAYFAMFTDKFGIQWMLNYDPKYQ